MTCGGCVASIKEGLQSVEGVTKASVQLNPPQAEVTHSDSVPLVTLQKAIGKYKISDVPEVQKNVEDSAKLMTTYKPLFLIVSFILGVAILVQFPFDELDSRMLMRNFMAGFFIVFSFFKLLNLEGFASSYSMYDIVAARWYGWGYIYPFVELGLGILYLTNVAPYLTNILTIIVLGISSIGVIQSNLQKRKIKCACLGDVFNLPMSTVTIVEDVSMILMAATMLLIHY